MSARSIPRVVIVYRTLPEDSADDSQDRECAARRTHRRVRARFDGGSCAEKAGSASYSAFSERLLDDDRRLRHARKEVDDEAIDCQAQYVEIRPAPGRRAIRQAQGLHETALARDLTDPGRVRIIGEVKAKRLRAWLHEVFPPPI
jgi:hypothetical protein